MYYKMKLIIAIYCSNLFKSLLDQPLAADLSLVMFIFAIIFFKSHSCYVKLNQWYQHNMCCTHSATLGLKYMCYDVLCTVWACLWTF